MEFAKKVLNLKIYRNRSIADGLIVLSVWSAAMSAVGVDIGKSTRGAGWHVYPTINQDYSGIIFRLQVRYPGSISPEIAGGLDTAIYNGKFLFGVEKQDYFPHVKTIAHDFSGFGIGSMVPDPFEIVVDPFKVERSMNGE